MSPRRLIPEHRITVRLLATAWLIALVLVLSACGGGETDEEAHKDTNPPACQQHPELCK